MKKYWTLLMLLLVGFNLTTWAQANEKIIRISTDETDLIYKTAPNGRLYQVYLGDKLQHEADIQHFSPFAKMGSDGSAGLRGGEIYMTSGAEDYFEPALMVKHADGNMSTILTYVSSEQKNLDGNATETIITLKDDAYPLQVILHFKAFKKENIITTWTEISHQEKKPIILGRYASSIIYFERPSYYLTEFSGDWAREMTMTTQQ